MLIHTGQHYDYELSQIFFDQMEIPSPKYHLGIGSKPHGTMAGTMLIKIESVLLKELPDWVLVYGDTNSTLAGALASVKLRIPVIHVEAGLRSYNRRMPEEINRVLTDRISCLLFCPSVTAVENLKKEGIVKGVFNVGDVMFDSYILYKELSFKRNNLLENLGLEPQNFYLATLHRQENTDDSSRLLNIFSAFLDIATKELPVVIPIHPRTRKALQEYNIDLNKNPYILLISPVSYLDMIVLESHARIIFTDSGGIQKEAFFSKVPCITLRDETEWVETVESGWNHLVGANKEAIVTGFNSHKDLGVKNPPDFYGRGNAAKLIIEHIISAFPFDLTSWNSVLANENQQIIQNGKSRYR